MRTVDSSVFYWKKRTHLYIYESICLYGLICAL